MTLPTRDGRHADDTGSLAMALLLTIVGITLSALLVPMVLTQLGSTRVSAQRADALNAAQAGLDAALGQIRAATDAGGNGAIQKLPCRLPVTAVGTASAASYEVTVTYLATDPRGRPDSWLDDRANQITCVAGSGTAGAAGYAVVRSTGTAGQAHRLLRSTYRFRITNQPIRGGLIHVTGTGLCLDAGSATPAAGAGLQVRPCSPDSPQQQFAYDKNLNVYLTSTRVPGSLGLCLDAGTPPHANSPVLLQPCATTTQPQQQWLFNDSANFQGTKDGSKPDNFCFTVRGTDPGSPVELWPCNQGSALSPEPFVGAGAAGASSQQVVNLSQFGRCMDVTDFDVDKGFLIVWPCKQAPDPADIGWNQKWSLPTIAAGAKRATGPITTTDDRGRRYCLHSPATTTAYVTVTLCPSNLALAQAWTVYGDTGDDLTSYHIQDSYGYCLSPTDPNATPPDFYTDTNGYQISKLVVADCNRSTLQMWNAPPLGAAVEDLREN